MLFDSKRSPENCLKLVMPSPTLSVASQVRSATVARKALLLTGVLMGGGPSSWATEDHHRAGLSIYATPDAARSFNDDLEAVRRDTRNRAGGRLRKPGILPPVRMWLR